MSRDTLLALDGVSIFLESGAGTHIVHFVVRNVEASRERPHGLNYSLTLHAPDGTRIAGFDNAHQVTGHSRMRTRFPGYDHRHRNARMFSYEFTDADTLLADFWMEVDRVMRERGGVS